MKTDTCKTILEVIKTSEVKIRIVYVGGDSNQHRTTYSKVWALTDTEVCIKQPARVGTDERIYIDLGTIIDIIVSIDAGQ